MSLSRRLSPVTARLAHILTVNQTSKMLKARSNGCSASLGIFFAGPIGDIYQVTQWIPVFEAIEQEFPSILFIKDARVAAKLAKLTRLPIRIAGHADAIEPLVEPIGIKALFYVNNNLANFSALRLPMVVHIHLSHGESEKISMVSNQLKAYDYCFLAGEAAAERVTSALQHFDDSRLRLIGRPQLDQLMSAKPFTSISGRQTVLYAPTWEGDRPAMAYSSVESAGVSWVSDILQDPSFRLIYRPHPKTGSRSKATRLADTAIRKLITDATLMTGDAGHLIDIQPDYHPALVSADIGIFDVSAMAMDFSILNRPYMVACPQALESTMSESPLWDVARKMVPEKDTDLVSSLHNALQEGLPNSASLFVEKHFGISDGENHLQRFIGCIKSLI